jgi:phosphoribosylaminoimidazole-succinocarboxamide synthase
MSPPVENALREQLSHTLSRTDFPELGKKYEGKVRDTYLKDGRLVLITTDRLSAFDHVLTTLPFKGDLLNQLAYFWFQKTSHVVKNHVIDMPDPAVIVARAARPFPIEFVVRGYLTGSLWRDYEAGRDPYELALPPGLQRDSRFERPLLTPSTKAPIGQHDEPLSEAQVVARALMNARDWARAREAALGLFAEGQKQCAARGLILVDTKYEFGLIGDELVVIDEMHTPDSSRFWMASEYAARFARGEAQLMLDKENLRQWLITERGFSGQGTPPQIPDDVRVDLAMKYVSAYEQLTGTTFTPLVGDVSERLLRHLRRAALLTK